MQEIVAMLITVDSYTIVCITIVNSCTVVACKEMRKFIRTYKILATHAKVDMLTIVDIFNITSTYKVLKLQR